jgi:hypothetical protein
MCGPVPQSDLERAYQERMSEAPQFKRFNIAPLWVPGTGDIEGFIHDEVVRQYHNTKIRDGKSRIEWMLQAWHFALRYADKTPTVAHLRELGRLVEPYVNDRGYRREPVWIGGRKAPDSHFIEVMIDTLFTKAERVDPIQGITISIEDASVGGFGDLVRRIHTADDFYLAYEWVHPWGDGNGRTGKILHNWLHGTLDEPVLVTDYFGGHNP